ncbi:beta-galactosidase [Chitinophaga alhagiae]|uniref:beta-galactosidase n=1 Tax=Chitinophaga alhagiae TaxID=2203219 RepID=UPI000E5AB776|nr:beta-galactosidase [Chitinophaga alhagiae]
MKNSMMKQVLLMAAVVLHGSFAALRAQSLPGGAASVRQLKGAGAAVAQSIAGGKTSVQRVNGAGKAADILQPLPARAEVKMHAGVPALYVNGRLTPPFAYMSYFGKPRYYREAAGAGIHLYNVPAYLGDQGINSSSGIKPFRQAIWQGPGKFDLSGLEKEMAELLEADPAARIIIRIYLDPPRWWEQQHPGGVALQPDGSSFRLSFSSPEWRQDAGDALRTLVRELLRSPYGNSLVGIHVAAGSTEEWFYHFKSFFHDGSDVRKTAFRQWLRQRYHHSADALKKAWGRDADFDNALPADISGAEKKNEWSTDARFINTLEFHGESLTDLVAYFCRIVKEASNGTLLTGAFYGYHLFVNDPRRGHSALPKLLQCKELDYLSSPNDYKRVAGEDWMPMAAIKSLQLHGKLWLAENDTRTFKTTLLRERRPDVEPPGDWYAKGVWIGPESPELSASLLKKNLARMLAYGYGGWWFDMWGGWFSDERLLAVLRQGQTYFAQYPLAETPQMRPQVAVVADAALQNRDASFGALTGEITGNRYALGKGGAPFDIYLRNDMDSIASPYKLVWLMGIMDVNNHENGLIKAWLARGMAVLHTDGRSSTFYLPGGNAPAAYPGKVKWDAAELAALYNKAGVHCYLPPGDVVYAGRGWLAVHSGSGGKKTVRLPAPATVTDPETKQVLGRNVRTFTINQLPGATGLFSIDFIH